MLNRVLPLLVLGLAVAFLVGAPALADEAKSHDGLIVKAGDGKLTMTDKEGKNQHTHNVAVDAVITCDGKVCRLDDLKPGFDVTVTTEKKAGQEFATKIAARKK
jgi:hypothetical protein